MKKFGVNIGFGRGIWHPRRASNFLVCDLGLNFGEYIVFLDDNLDISLIKVYVNVRQLTEKHIWQSKVIGFLILFLYNFEIC